jgi:hypothetical protein
VGLIRGNKDLLGIVLYLGPRRATSVIHANSRRTKFRDTSRYQRQELVEIDGRQGARLVLAIQSSMVMALIRMMSG